jgi:hypothetical protein
VSTSPPIVPALSQGGTITGPLTVTGFSTLHGGQMTGNELSFTATSGLNTATEAAGHILAPAFASGTASQLTDTTRDYIVYFTVTTGGTLTVAIGPTVTPAETLISAATVTAGQLITFRLPAAWYCEITEVTTVLSQLAIGC